MVENSRWFIHIEKTEVHVGAYFGQYHNKYYGTHTSQ